MMVYNSRRLSIITAYHGIEFFLYSVLTEENININIFDKNGTIGMYKALNKFQEFLKAEKTIKKSDTIDYKISLMDLKIIGIISFTRAILLIKINVILW